MGLMDSIKDTLFEEAATPAVKPGTVVKPTLPPRPFTSSATAVPQSEAEQALQVAVLARDTPYSRFLKTVAALSMIPDEAARFQAAMASLGAAGVQPADIRRAVTVHQQELESQKATFETRLREEQEQQVGATGRQLDQARKDLDAARERVVTLERQVAELAPKVDAAADRLVRAHEEFTAAYTAVKARLADHAARIGG